MQRKKESLIKVFFELDPGCHESASESVWAEPEGRGRYRIRNCPFYIYGISVEDIVFAEKNEDQLLWASGVFARSGHSTYRLRLMDGVSQKVFQEYWEPLEQIGCTYEAANESLKAVDVPPSTNIHEAYRLLERGEKGLAWTFEEGHCGHLID